MTSPSLHRAMRPTTVLTAALAIGLLTMSACATAPAAPGSMTADMSTSPPSPDPRVGLRAGHLDAGQASWNMRLVSNTPPSADFVGVTNSDLAFSGNYVYQGSYNGYQVWDITNPQRPTLKDAYLCPASQSDVSVYRNLLFVSGEGLSGRLDCGTQGVQDSVSADRLRGIRIFDVADVENPRYVGNVQTCRGSHTHTMATDPRDSNNVYIYVSGSSRVRSPSELPGCSGLSPDEDPNSALFRIEVIRVPLAAPERAAIVSSPRIFDELAAPPRRGQPAAAQNQPGAAAAARQRTGPTQCHDITTYPEVGLAGGACGGYGLLLDISDVANPRRIDAAADSNMSFWHSATFSNDGDKVLFTDEWGGGRAPRCRVTDNYEWGANALFTIENRRMVFKSYYKMPAAQTEWENCVAHNGSLIPIPGREVMVQAWYQGGISIFDWTDVSNPKEIAFFDRGPLEDGVLTSAGSWSVYWYNGNIVSSEIARGLDIFALTPSAFISQNEIDAANTVRFDFMNAQEQRKFIWPASFPLARAYLDQLERNNGLDASRIAAARAELSRAERASGMQRGSALAQLATRLTTDAAAARDATKVRKLATAVAELSAAN
ncbi:MAG: hypothetical protein KFH98_15835 [Gemmatimonadetes bacterium]|nr:hypothetical protein [Gemmatimonadota bacterium]